jgi:hypothetical protein
MLIALYLLMNAVIFISPMIAAAGPLLSEADRTQWEAGLSLNRALLVTLALLIILIAAGARWQARLRP